MGQNTFAVQFTQWRENITNYLQCMSEAEGYLVAQTVRTGKKQMIHLPPPVDKNTQVAANQQIIRAEEVKLVRKRQQKVEESLKKGYMMVYSQCLQEVRDKLKAMEDWKSTPKEQALHDLIQKIEKICVGFDNHKPQVFNLVQSLKTLFQYSQSEKNIVKEYGQNFRSLWDTVEAFGGLPGIHTGLLNGLLSDLHWVRDINNPTNNEITDAENNIYEAVKAALLISGGRQVLI
jgi:hypothetical protein